MPQPSKPPYRVPTMAEVAAARGSAGLTVASTFSGCGGSCTGFEMAGYRVVWANEFLPIARESYAANHPHTLLDGRDIRKVQASEILEAAGLAPGELDVFNGSPPCQAFSSAGKGARGWGTEREYANGVSQKNEELFFDFIRLLKGLQPRAFVAENVAGLVRGAAIGMFKIIMRELMDAGYTVRCKVLDAQWLGVPQSRTRAIFIGVRSDLGEAPEFPKPLPYRYTLREAVPGIGRVVYDTQTSNADFVRTATIGVGEPCRAVLTNNSHHFKVTDTPTLPPKSRAEWEKLRPGQSSEKYFNLVRSSLDEPSPVVVANQGNTVTHPTEPRKFSIDELRAICGFPPDYELRGTFSEQWARLGNAVPPLMMRAVAEVLRDGLFTRIGRTRRAA